LQWNITIIFAFPSGERLWSTSTGIAGIEANVAYVISPRQPADESLQAKTISAMRASAIVALVRIPIVESVVDVSSFEGCEQFVSLPVPHGAANDFPNARHKQIHGFLDNDKRI